MYFHPFTLSIFREVSNTANNHSETETSICRFTHLHKVLIYHLLHWKLGDLI